MDQAKPTCTEFSQSVPGLVVEGMPSAAADLIRSQAERGLKQYGSYLMQAAMNGLVLAEELADATVYAAACMLRAQAVYGDDHAVTVSYRNVYETSRAHYVSMMELVQTTQEFLWQ